MIGTATSVDVLRLSGQAVPIGFRQALSTCLQKCAALSGLASRRGSPSNQPPPSQAQRCV